MKRIAFFSLARDKQDRFVASTKGEAPPAHIMRLKGPGNLAFIFFGVGGAALLFTILFAVMGYGVLGNPSAVRGGVGLVLFILALFLFPFGVLQGAGLMVSAKKLPFKPGIYVFPMCLVDARTKSLRVFSMTDLVRFEKAEAGGQFRLVYKGGTFAFPAGDAANAQELAQTFDLAQQQAKHAMDSQDESELINLDPFYDAKKYQSPIAPKQAMRDKSPPWARLAPVVAGGLAIVLGPALWYSRNSASDEAMFKKAQAEDTPEAYKKYLAVGKRHDDEVSGTLLPRAELKVAQSKQTVEAVQEFIDTHPQSKIDVEAQAALKEALLRELDKAKAIGTVTAIADFVKKYPAHHLEADVAKARHALFVDVLTKFKARAAKNDPVLIGLVQRLLAYLESKGPMITVTVRREISDGLSRANKMVGSASTNRAFGPDQVTKYFDPNARAPKESEVAQALGSVLGEVFPADMATFVYAAAPSDDQAVQLAGKGPLLLIRYKIGWLGSAYISQTIKRVFAGISLSGDATFSLPNDQAPLKVKLDVSASRGLPTEVKGAHATLSAPGPLNEEAPEKDVYMFQELRGLDLMVTAVERAILKPK